MEETARVPPPVRTGMNCTSPKGLSESATPLHPFRAIIWYRLATVARNGQDLLRYDQDLAEVTTTMD